jgi:hypothetical protein
VFDVGSTTPSYFVQFEQNPTSTNYATDRAGYAHELAITRDAKWAIVNSQNWIHLIALDSTSSGSHVGSGGGVSVIKQLLRLAILMVAARSSGATQTPTPCPSTYLGDWYPSTFNPGGAVGLAVASNSMGTVLAIGCPAYVQAGQRSGAVCVLDASGPGSRQEDLASPPLASNAYRFGSSIGLDAIGETLAVGAEGGNSRTSLGQAFVYRQIAGQWMLDAQFVGMATDAFGFKVALSGDGKRLVVSAPLRLAAGFTGVVFIYERLSTGWAFESALTSNDPHPNGFFGWSAALNDAGDRLLVGAPTHVNDGVVSGAVEEFVATGGGWSFVARHRARIPELAASFGRSVATSATGARWSSGEWRSDLYGVDHGRVHLFEIPPPRTEDLLPLAAQHAGLRPAHLRPRRPERIVAERLRDFRR